MKDDELMAVIERLYRELPVRLTDTLPEEGTVATVTSSVISSQPQSVAPLATDKVEEPESIGDLTLLEATNVLSPSDPSHAGRLLTSVMDLPSPLMTLSPHTTRS